LARRRKRRPTISLNQEDDCDEQNGPQVAAVADENAVNPADELVRREQKEKVRRAVESLPTKQRAALILAYYQQLSYREVAQALNCSVGAVKTHMSRALATLAQRLPDSIGATK